MTWQGQRLVKVRSQSELRPGMTVIYVDCGCCLAKRHVEVLLRQIEVRRCGGRGPHVAWQLISNCKDGCYCEVIALGKLWRLPDEETGTTETRRARKPEGAPA